MGKMMSPNTRIDWFPLNAFADPSKPTVAELNAGINISCAIQTGYTLNFTDSDTDDSKTICDEGNVQNRGFANYEANLTAFRDPIDAVKTSVFTTFRDLFKDGRVEGYLVSRQGKKAAVAYSVEDYISIFKVTSDYMQEQGGDGGGPVTVTVPFGQQGVAYPNIHPTA